MPVTQVRKDTETLTLTLTATFAAPLERVWQMWSDPRRLERWWGPPTYPATMVEHDLSVGGRVRYFMTGPTGDQHHGWWRILAVDAPRSLEFEDGFADATGAPNAAMPVTIVRVALTHVAGTTTLSVASRFSTIEQMEQLVRMGMVEGLTAAVGQIDALLAA